MSYDSADRGSLLLAFIGVLHDPGAVDMLLFHSSSSHSNSVPGLDILTSKPMFDE